MKKKQMFDIKKGNNNNKNKLYQDWIKQTWILVSSRKIAVKKLIKKLKKIFFFAFFNFCFFLFYPV
jgi:hypothetical protein